jgi:hypothetical protein
VHPLGDPAAISCHGTSNRDPPSSREVSIASPLSFVASRARREIDLVERHDFRTSGQNVSNDLDHEN